MLLKFHTDAIYNGEVVYTAGIHDVPADKGWARRWLNRGAELVEETSKVVDLSTDHVNTVVEAVATKEKTGKSKAKKTLDATKEL